MSWSTEIALRNPKSIHENTHRCRAAAFLMQPIFAALRRRMSINKWMKGSKQDRMGKYLSFLDVGASLSFHAQRAFPCRSVSPALPLIINFLQNTLLFMCTKNVVSLSIPSFVADYMPNESRFLFCGAREKAFIQSIRCDNVDCRLLFCRLSETANVFVVRLATPMARCDCSTLPLVSRSPVNSPNSRAITNSQTKTKKR